MGIARKNESILPHYKTILGHGQGTFAQGSLTKNHAPLGGHSAIRGAVKLGIGSNATSGVKFETERSHSVNVSKKK